MEPIPVRIASIVRPSEKLWSYYIWTSILSGPAFPVTILLLYFKYYTMHYRFDAEGIRMGWGILFRQETVVNYARIQDIHLQSNIIERWLGLARIIIQTAGGGTMGNLTLEGIVDCEGMRDFLYSRMRGAKDPHRAAPPESDLAATLRDVAAELRAIRETLERRGNA